jgi:hypothetical protein
MPCWHADLVRLDLPAAHPGRPRTASPFWAGMAGDLLLIEKDVSYRRPVFLVDGQVTQVPGLDEGLRGPVIDVHDRVHLRRLSPQCLDLLAEPRGQP